MNKKETSKIIAVLMASYPNFLSNKNADDIQATINIWNEMLADYSYQEVSIAVKACITSKSNFAPSIGQVIDKILSFRNQGTELTEQEAWNIVSKAVKNSAYHATEEFEKFPEVLKRLVGSPAQLKEWGQMDVDTVQSVVASNLMRSYKAKVVSNKEYQALPNDVKNLVEQTTKKLIGGELS